MFMEFAVSYPSGRLSGGRVIVRQGGQDVATVQLDELGRPFRRLPDLYSAVLGSTGLTHRINQVCSDT
jgi:hypothetical protein